MEVIKCRLQQVTMHRRPSLTWFTPSSHGARLYSTDPGTDSLIAFRWTLHGFRYRPSGKDLPPQEIKLPPTFQTIVGA